jgi:hypothetical protein
VLAILVLCSVLTIAARAQDLARFDLTDPGLASAWQPAHDISGVAMTRQGLRIAISGADPYLIGPTHDYPSGQSLWLQIRLRSDVGGMGQVFYFNTAPNERDSVRFPVRAGQWEEIRAPLPPLGPGFRLRFDPPGSRGNCLVSLLAVSPRTIPLTPNWPHPQPPELDRDTLRVQSGDLELIQAHHQFGGFAVRVAGKSMATGDTHPMIGYQIGMQTRWFDLASSAISTATQDDQGAITARATARDPDGGTWDIEQRFAHGRPGEIVASTVVRVDQDRTLLFMPMLILFPGAGGFGPTKHQALFAGLEYLDGDEPSSSEADVIGPASHRQVPDSAKITLPLMAVQQDGRYVGLTWEPGPEIAALFDSPDRTLHGGGHLLGLIAPGSDGVTREEGSLVPYEGMHLGAGQALTLRAAILGGVGDDVTPAVQQVVASRGLPGNPPTGADWKRYAALVTAGWLQSGLKAGDLYRHAYPNFTPQPAADAALCLDYIEERAPNRRQAASIRQAARAAIDAVPPADRYASGVGHIRTPAAMLTFGPVAQDLARAHESAQSLLARFAPDGTVPYVKPATGPDLGRTHFAREANGMAAQVVAELLETAALAGDFDLIETGLRRLRALSRFNSTAPRGAQTWEVPLHTPDILAAAYLVRAYTLGYALTGDESLLVSARYWAWTGVPFVYLINPLDRPVGPYATIAVYGATQWVAPVWMGLPVQWCGLVYADALYRLADYDSAGPWGRLADGITASGIQQTWPLGSDPDRQGLLPDSYDLKAEARNDPAINPATLFVNAVRFYRQPLLYDFRSCMAGRVLIHAPGKIEHCTERSGRVTFVVRGWWGSTYTVLVHCRRRPSHVRINGKEVRLATANQIALRDGTLALPVRGTPTIQVETQ